MTRVGRDLKDHVVPTPLPGRATKHTPLLDQVAQGPVQPGLEHLQGRGIHNLPGQPVPGPNHSPSEELHLCAVSVLFRAQIVGTMKEEYSKTRGKIKYLNTYRLEPFNKFQDQLVRSKAQAILTNKLQETKYDAGSSPSLCTSLSEEILKATKEMGFDRYKYVVTVLIAEKAGQSINVASRWVWDVQRDTWVSAECETKTFIALALIMACYYE
uniref:Dynein light chain Tctex-type 2 n=1 Tax=Coturnix japonica TaxID=93934 RepID=A0A8C2SU90_COTJA